uniref:Uncharacterized protein n=1 Tax=Anguilla anguilla TaxID=7936 RepID=A0A0E9RLQ3_ANGAN
MTKPQAIPGVNHSMKTNFHWHKLLKSRRLSQYGEQVVLIEIWHWVNPEGLTGLHMPLNSLSLFD